MQAVRIYSYGTPAVIRLENLPKPEPRDGFVRVKNLAIGLNNIDSYHRNGLYPIDLPSGLGLEGAGVVDAIAKSENNWKIGDKVAYVSGPIGAYAQYHCVRADSLIKLPEFIDPQIAAAALLKAMTVRYLFCETYNLQPGQTILFHAAAGGLGSIALQWAKAIGVQVIATAGGKLKCDAAKKNGADYVIDYNNENVTEKLMQITDGKGVPVVYDGVGKDTLQTSIECLQKRGLLVSFGNASGAIENFNLARLAKAGSIYLTRPTLAHYIPNRYCLEKNVAEVFDKIKNQQIKIEVNNRYKLKETKIAHQQLAQRKIVGLSIIIP